MPVARGRILVVDDDPDLRRVLVSILVDEGYGVVEAANGADALEILREDRSFILILLDLVMPVLDGWQFREEQSGDPALALIPVVAMSTYASHGEHVPPQATPYLEKPFRASVLLGIIKTNARAPTISESR